MSETKAKKTLTVKRPYISLAVKLNLLVVALIFTIATVLIIISYNVYTKNVYDPVLNDLTEWINDFDCSIEGIDDASDEVDSPSDVNYPAMLERLLVIAHSEELQEIRNSSSDSQEVNNQVGHYLESLSAYTSASTLETGSPASDYLQVWYMLNRERRLQSDEQDHDLNAIWIEGDVNGTRYLLAIDRSETSKATASVSTHDEYFGAILEIDPAFAGYALDEAISPTLVRNADGQALTAVQPIRNADGKVIARLWAQMDVNEIMNARHSFMLTCILMTVGLALFACFVTMLQLKHIVLRPIRDLSKAARDFAAEEKGQTRTDVAQLRIRSNDEIGDLYREIQSMETRIIDYTEEKTRNAAEQERIQTELDLAARIQNSRLPHTFPPFPDRNEFEIFASMNPAKEVAGDFYDFFFIDPDHLCLLIADVSGKGVPASLYMMISKVILKSCALQNLPPDEIMRKANEALSTDNPEKMFVTVWLGVLEVSTGKLTAVNAGHEYPALMRAGSGFEILKDKHGLFVGAVPSYPYKSYDLQLEAGDKLFVYTDGVPEATDRSNAMFGMKRLDDTLNQLTAESPEGILRGVRESVDRFVDGAPQFDDLTMLCIEYKGPQSDPAVSESQI